MNRSGTKLVLVGVSGFSERWVKVLFGSRKVIPAALVNHRAERFPELCKRLGFPESQCFTSLGEALSSCDAEGVVVSVPTRVHYPYVKEALLAGKHVLVEKPLAQSLGEGARLVELAKKKGRLLSVVSQHRFAPYLKTVKRYCSPGGPLGNPLTFFVRLHMNRPQSYYEAPARRRGPGVLAIQGAHPLDWIGWLFGEAESCAAAAGTLYHKTENEDTAYALFRMKSGVMGLFDINHITRGRDEVIIEVCFEKGNLRYSSAGGMRVEQGKVERKIEIRKADPQSECLRQQLENFADACQGRAEPEVGAEDGLRVMRLLDALYRSAGRLTPVK